jgi:hypothetical protein
MDEIMLIRLIICIPSKMQFQKQILGQVNFLKQLKEFPPWFTFDSNKWTPVTSQQETVFNLPFKHIKKW